MPDGSAIIPGLHSGIEMADYLKLAAVGAHDLYSLHTECPAMARYHKDHPNSETRDKALGTAMHTLTLEPDSFAARYAVRPVNGPRGNSNEYKAWAAEHVAAGREIVTADAWARMQSMRAALPKSARRLLAKGRPEMTAICHHAESGLDIRTRPDWLRDEGIVIDLKTTVDVRPSAWARQAANLGFHVSAALCIDVLREITGETFELWFLVMQKEPPYLSYFASLSPADVELGRRIYHGSLMTWAACARANDWPGFGDVVNLQLPAWAHPKEIE